MTGAAGFTGGCEIQSVGFRLAGLDIKGGQGKHHSRESGEQTQTPQSELPVLNFRQPDLQVSPTLERRGSSPPQAPRLLWPGPLTHLKPQYVFTIIF